MIKYKELWENERDLRLLLQWRVERWEEHCAFADQSKDLALESRREAWKELNAQSCHIEVLKARLDELAHELGVVTSERNQLAATVVSAALGRVVTP